MPRHTYRLEADQGDVLEYKKKHSDGYKTIVQATDLGTGWRAFARDYPPGGGAGQKVDLGTFGTKSEARRALTAWMNRNPDGVGGGGLFGGGGLDFGGGLF